MAFKIATGPKKVWWPVDIKVPVDGGGAEVQKIDAEFEILPQSEHDAIIQGKSDRTDLLERVVTGLRQRKADRNGEDQPLMDENGAELDLDTAKRLLLELTYARVALYGAYNLAAAGQGRVKN